MQYYWNETEEHWDLIHNDNVEVIYGEATMSPVEHKRWNPTSDEEYTTVEYYKDTDTILICASRVAEEYMVDFDIEIPAEAFRKAMNKAETLNISKDIEE